MLNIVNEAIEDYFWENLLHVRFGKRENMSCVLYANSKHAHDTNRSKTTKKHVNLCLKNIKRVQANGRKI